MASVINTNVLSLNAQRNLNSSQSSLATSIQRLSSGLRINSAKDDAAGLAISDRMTSQIRGFNQAMRNAADGISLAQVGEGALQQVTNNLQRMRELAIQSVNATNSAEDRISLDEEFQQLLAANDALAKTTSFNGSNVLDGSLGNAVFQVGANVGETISVDVNASMRNSDIGKVGFSELQFAAANETNTGADLTLDQDQLTLGAGQITVNGTAIGAATDDIDGKSDGSAFQIAAAINQLTSTTGVTATAGVTTSTITAADFSNALTFTDDLTDDTLTYALEINGTAITTQTEGAKTITSQSDLVTLINAQADTTGVTATMQSNNDIVLTAADGRNIEFAELFSGGTEDTDAVTGFFGDTMTNTAGANDLAVSHTARAGIELSSSDEITVTDVVGDDHFFGGIANGGSQITGAAIESSSVRTVTESNNSIRRIDQAIRDVDTLRGTFGAIQARFESTMASLSTSAENVSAARSRILDADFAQETAALTRAQILQQAGTAMLAQANASQQGVLSLLQ